MIGDTPTDLDALRDHLAAHNGIRGLEIFTPDQVDEIVARFRRDGFAVVADALDADQLATMRAGCDRVLAEILAVDPDMEGNRGSRRWSFGAASTTGSQLHNPEWRMLLDLPTITPIVTAIFGSDDYHLRGSGGDVCLPGAVEYQHLHSDLHDRFELRGHTLGTFHDPTGRMSVRDLPVPQVTCNFLMVDFTPLNGPTRQIPGTQNSRARMPLLDDEPEWMKLSTVCPAPAGAVLIRDVRAWHGGTPNLSDEARAIPNVEFTAPWYRERTQVCIDRADWLELSDHARRVSRFCVADSSERVDARTIKGWTPGTALA